MYSFSLQVALLSAEVAPLAKVGGLADVAGALPKALKSLGVDVRVFMPYYGVIDTKVYKLKKVIAKLTVPLGERDETVSVWQTRLPASMVPVYLIKHRLFSGRTIYGRGSLVIGTHERARGSNDVVRFSFFTQAALEVCRALEFRPDIVHAHDWHTALAAQILRTHNVSDNFFINTKTVYTIHNLAHQGITTPEIIRYAKVNPHFPIVKADAEDGDINFMVQGILGSDAITTVSPRYAVEILHHYQGAGLDNVLRKRKRDLYGILNGIDTDIYNPATDKYIRYRYDVRSLIKKQNNKTVLQKQLGLPVTKDACLVGFISRLAWQKGVELINETLVKNVEGQFVVLGTGQKEYEEQLKKLTKKYPQKVKTIIGFDAGLAQQIYAASDIFLVPSRFEPCGLTQMLAMRYGSVPVARATGGLADTVVPANGFLFKEFTAAALERALQRALKVYYTKPKKWQKLQHTGMRTDFSWKESAKKYLALYKKLVEQRA